MAKAIRTEGDYKYYDDGFVRWAPGNSQGKQIGALAKRPPYAAKPLEAGTSRKVRNGAYPLSKATSLLSTQAGGQQAAGGKEWKCGGWGVSGCLVAGCW